MSLQELFFFFFPMSHYCLFSSKLIIVLSCSKGLVSYRWSDKLSIVSSSSKLCFQRDLDNTVCPWRYVSYSVDWGGEIGDWTHLGEAGTGDLIATQALCIKNTIIKWLLNKWLWSLRAKAVKTCGYRTHEPTKVEEPSDVVWRQVHCPTVF